MQNDDDSAWHLDRRVPIGLIASIVVQTVVFVYVGTSWKSDVDHRLVTLEVFKTDKTQKDAPQEARLIVLEQKFNFIEESLRRIEGKLDRDSEIKRQ